MLFFCLLALINPFGSLAYIYTYIHTNIHLKYEEVTSGTKMEDGQLHNYIENEYTSRRHFKDIYRYYTVPFYFALTIAARV